MRIPLLSLWIIQVRSDWGKNIGDGNTWRTLTKEEWAYLINYDTVNDNLNNNPNSPRYNRFKLGVTVCGKTNCLVLAPDDWDISSNALQSEYSATSTPMTWEQAEAVGLVCLPAAGGRDGSNVWSYDEEGYYWSSNSYSSILTHAFCLFFDDDSCEPFYQYRSNGLSVRLVTECQ